MRVITSSEIKPDGSIVATNSNRPEEHTPEAKRKALERAQEGIADFV
ncbi:MAG: hypothetical protein PHG24_01640 [Candidatus Pacebacteria bacterium]|nr:hypothetical protein [Candidatus Paceibacterota bacterium]